MLESAEFSIPFFNLHKALVCKHREAQVVLAHWSLLFNHILGWCAGINSLPLFLAVGQTQFLNLESFTFLVVCSKLLVCIIQKIFNAS